jgi:hypothetical protein
MKPKPIQTDAQAPEMVEIAERKECHFSLEVTNSFRKANQRDGSYREAKI